LHTNLLDSRFRGNDRHLSHFVIPAKAGIHVLLPLFIEFLQMNGETEVWLDFSKDFGYIKADQYQQLMERYDEVNRMLYGMVDKADKFCR